MAALARSDTLEALDPVWSNVRPPGGPTPIPPRNEPLLYIPSDNFPPKLLKLIYLASHPQTLFASSSAATIRSENNILDTSSDASLLDAPVASGTISCHTYINILNIL